MITTKLPRNVAADSRSAKLSQLSEEVRRISALLASLAADQEGVMEPHRESPAHDGSRIHITREAVQDVINARHLRHKFFGVELFGDPAWDMLLELFRAEIEQHRVSVSALTIAANVPSTTALRWIKTMTEKKIFCRSADPTDARRFFLELSPQSSKAMHAYFEELGRAHYESPGQPAG